MKLVNVVQCSVNFQLWYYFLTLSWRRLLTYRNQSMDLLCKSMDWFLYDRTSILKELRFFGILWIAYTNLWCWNFDRKYYTFLQRLGILELQIRVIKSRDAEWSHTLSYWLKCFSRNSSFEWLNQRLKFCFTTFKLLTRTSSYYFEKWWNKILISNYIPHRHRT